MHKRITFQVALLLFISGSFFSSYTLASCPAPGNAIEAENCLTGTAQSVWDITGSGDATIQGFADNISVNVGQTINFKIKTPATGYHLDIYRMGYYQGNGARLVTTIQPSAKLPQNQPNCVSNASVGLYDCGNWVVSATWSVPSTAVSGIYFARVIRNDTLGASHIVFIVRNDTSHSDILFQASDTTWQAYNDSVNGQNLYTNLTCGQWVPSCRSYKVSYNRPFNTRVFESNDWVFNAEYPMVRWLEANGYDVTYFTDTDTDRNGALILNHKLWTSNGHDEYWSGQQRANIEAARNAGKHLAFFSGNTMFWKTRWENSVDGTNSPYRTLVCYKETYLDVSDPFDPPLWTGTWRDPRLSPPADGGRPENAVKGNLFRVNSGNYAITVPAANGKMRLWRNTSVAAQSSGSAILAPGTLGAEFDDDEDNGFRPAGLFQLSSTSITDASNVLLDNGVTYGAGTVAHEVVMYHHPSGALVFSTGTYQWSWGLDNHHDSTNLGATTNTAMQQATVNLFADMGIQPVSLQSGLTRATASTDITPPVSSITTPSNGSTIAAGTSVTIGGTASDTGGVIAGVEVSTDAGTTWHPAAGLSTWTYTWTASGTSASIRSRAVDDSGNLETPSIGVNITIGGGTSCTGSNCTIWPSTTTPTLVDGGPDSAVELGVKFKSDVTGTITGIRFYKASTNTGTHVGNLWSSAGALLASATFISETASGWQQVNFTTPVPITANTVYVASYHANTGHYSDDLNFFVNTGADNPPLHALANSVSFNGVYAYGATSAFPNQTWNSSNYWVDAVFSTGSASTLSAITTASLPGGTVNTAYSATLVASGGTLPYTWSIIGSLPGGLNLNSVTGVISGIPTVVGSFSFNVRVTDSANPVASITKALSITIAAAPTNLTIWPSTAVPTLVDAGPDSAVELGVNFKSDNNGAISGIRFYKAITNTGTHVGNLWSSAGALLASAPFTGETASGWQQVNFTTPVSINANTIYVASYHTNAGHYSDDVNYFASKGMDSPPLHALANSVSTNGVYAYGAISAFPNQTWNTSNYWVDVVFN